MKKTKESRYIPEYDDVFLKTEVAILNILKHPGIVKLEGVYPMNTDRIIVLEKMDGDFVTFVEKKVNLYFSLLLIDSSFNF